MSELIQKSTEGRFRERLLTTVCALALIASIGVRKEAMAEDVDRPTVWIELGPQMERVSDSQEAFDPGFLGKFDQLGFVSPLPIQRPSRYAIGGEGSVLIEPRGSDWVVSVSARYGRSNGQKSLHQQTPTGVVALFPNLGNFIVKNLDASASNEESHAIVDFHVGRDVGLGIFTTEYSSILSLGVRFAQFESRQTANLDGVPDVFRSGVAQIPHKYPYIISHHHYVASVVAEHDFQGIGPSLSWGASRTVLGARDDAGFSLDWGVNAALLIGRQTVRGENKKSDRHYEEYKVTPKIGQGPQVSSYVSSSVLHNTAKLNRSRTVAVPNLGGFAGLSFRYSNAKVSLGYRADFFFGAMDGGIDTRKTYNQSFYGPFATVSIGLGG